MIKYAVIFLIVSVIAGALGYANISAVARRISLILFGVFLGLAVLAFVAFLILEQAVR